MRRSLKIPFLTILIAGFFMFSKGAMVNYSLAFLYDAGFAAWVASFFAFGIRIVSTFSARILRNYKIEQDEGRVLVGFFSIIMALGYIMVTQITEPWMMFVVTSLLGIGILGQILNQGDIYTSINKFGGKTDFPVILAGADVMKLAINLTISVVIAALVSFMELQIILIIIAVMHVLFAAYMLRGVNLKSVLHHHDRISSKKSTIDISDLNPLILVSIAVMFVATYMSVVPVFDILDRFELDNSWVGVLTVVGTAAYSLSFVSSLVAARIGIFKVMLVVGSFMGFGAVVLLLADDIGVYLFGAFLIYSGIGWFFVVNAIYVNNLNGNTNQKLSAYFYKVNFWQPFAFFSVPFLLKYEIHDYLLGVATVVVLIAIANLVFLKAKDLKHIDCKD